ncbi:helix-turn-helix domain-containing protein [Bacillus mycoides]|uniref:helix-turn-helix domain-containing protein n=1 Tax=Bacillus mycoides TaxID=1405 RepID=UPI0021135810|nr:helix-turn-helix domain-containing protein [Bacillus mycoides]MCQ6530733.1 winged helix-turn-helix transcriptional regulator [Bacillus mycoides]
MTVKEIFKVEHTTSTEKLVLLYLQHRGCGKRHTEIKHEEIIKSCNISQSSVNRALKGLESKGLIDVLYQRGYSLAKHIKLINNDKEV